MQLYWKETTTQVLSFEYCKLFKNSLFYRPHSEVVFPSSTKNNLQNSSLELLSLWQCIYFCTSLNINFLSQEIFSGRIDVTSHKVNFRLDTREAVFWKKSGHLEFAWLLKQFGATKPWWLSNSGKHMSLSIQYNISKSTQLPPLLRFLHMLRSWTYSLTNSDN